MNIDGILKKIAPIISEWPFPPELKRDMHVKKWIMQFEPEDYELAVRIIEKITIIKNQDFNAHLKSLHGRMSRRSTNYSEINKNNTLYIGIAQASKSQGIISYYLRTSLELPENNFIALEEFKKYKIEKIKNVVIVDDIIGTGKTLLKIVDKVENNFKITEKLRIYVLTICGYEEGIKMLKEKQVEVFCGNIYSKEDTINDIDGKFYEGLSYSEANSMQKRLYEYNRKISSGESGHGKIGGLVVFEYSTPNTTIPVIWATGKEWYRLFPRAKNKKSGIKKNDNAFAFNGTNYTDEQSSDLNNPEASYLKKQSQKLINLLSKIDKGETIDYYDLNTFQSFINNYNNLLKNDVDYEEIKLTFELLNEYNKLPRRPGKSEIVTEYVNKHKIVDKIIRNIEKMEHM